MFVPVACLKCRKLFQVPEAATGTEVACPWCTAATPALPVASVPPVPPARSNAEVLSLDDAPPADGRGPPVTRPPARAPFTTVLIAGALILVVFAATVAVLGYGSGRIGEIAWAAFTPPDGSCTVVLPGTPAAERVEPAGGVTRGGERFVTTGWYSRATVWVGWQDLDPGQVKDLAADRDGVLTAPIIDAERDRRRDQVGGTVTKEATVRFGAYTGREVQMDTPRGQLVEWFILALDGPRPRLYFLGIEAKHAPPDGPAARKLFSSFRINNG